MKKIFLITVFLFLAISVNLYGQAITPINAAIDNSNSLVNNNEPSIAINPLDQNNIIIATNYRRVYWDGTKYNYDLAKLGLYYTTDFGTSWSNVFMPNTYNYIKYADPSVAFTSDGNAVYCSYLGVNDPGDQKTSLFVNKSIDKGKTWMPVPYILPVNGNLTQDKPYIYIDNNSGSTYKDRVYVSYSESIPPSMGSGLNRIMLTYLDKNSNTFVSPQLLNIPDNYWTTQGSIPCSDNLGNLYVAFYVKEKLNDAEKIVITKSTDGGSHFLASPIDVARIKESGYFENGVSYNVLTVDSHTFRVNSCPSMAINKSTNTIYIVYSSKESNEIGESADIMFTKSTDGGFTWSSPTMVNADYLGEQFSPWITVNNNGVISIVYYELLNNKIKPKLAMSENGGSSFYEANILDEFTLTGSCMEKLNMIGDYIGIASTSDYAIPVWTSTNTALTNKPEICKIALVPFKIPAALKNMVNGTAMGRMSLDGATKDANGSTVTLNPYISHNFGIVDETYSSGSNIYKFRTWDDNSFGKIRTSPANSIGNGQVISTSYNLAFPLIINNNLEGGSGGSNTIQWSSTNHSESYPDVNSGSTFYAFNYANNYDIYSISAPKYINNYLGTNWTFQNWNDGSTSLTKQNLQITGPVSYTAYYKGSLRSNTTASFANTSQRKFIRTPDGSLHLVYESMGYVWYERSTDGGNSWIIMNGGKPLSTNPSKSPSIDYCGNSTQGNIGIVFQEKNPNLWESEGKIKYYPVFYSNGVYGNSPLQDIEFLYDEAYDSFNVSPVIAFGSTSPYFLVVWKGLEGLTTKYFNGNNSNAIAPLSYSSVLYSVSDQISEHPFLVSNKLGNTGFHLAWDENTSSTAGAIRYCKLSAGTTVDIVGGSYNSNVSSGCGFSKNLMPSMIPCPDNSVRMSWLGSEIYDMTCSVFRGMYSDGSWNPRFWSFGSNVASQCINLGSDGYFILFSDYISGSYKNQFTDSRTLSNIYTLNTTGKDIQLNNDAGGTSRTMYAMSFSSQSGLPYSFTKSNTIGSYYGLYKENSKETSGRAIVLKTDSLPEFYFSLRDISLDGKPVRFMEVNDSLRIHDVNGMDKYMITEPFTLTDNSKFLFNINYGVTDSAKGLKALGKEGIVSYNVELIDEEGKVLQNLNTISISKNSFLKHKKGSFQVNMQGIGTKIVRMRLRTEVNFSSECFLVDSHSMTDDNGNLYKSSETEKLDYSGEKVIKEYAISRNYPNPFNPTTVIDFEVPKTSKVTLKVYDMLGREVATLVNGYKEQGRYSVEFNASSLPSGTYIYEIRANDFVKSGKMMLLK